MKFADTEMILSGPIGPALYKMTLPMVFGVSAVVGLTLVDSYFVAQLGTAALAAIGFTFPIVLFISAITTGLGAGVSTIVAQAIGRGEQEDVQRLTKHSLLFGLILVGTIIVAGMLTIDPLFTALGADADTLPLVRAYMEYWYPGMLFLIIPMIGNSAIRGTGDTRIPSYIMINAAAINIALDPVFIFGLGPVPALGIKGAAIASIFARATSFAATMWLLPRKYGMLDLSTLHRSTLIDSWKRLLHIGVPASMTQLLVPLGLAVFTRLASEFGRETVAAIGAAVRIESFAMIPFIALGTSIMPFAGQNWGAGKHDRVVRGISLSNMFAMGWGAACFIVLLILAGPLAALFSKDPRVVDALILYLRIVSVGYGFSGVTYVAAAAFNATRQPMKSTLLMGIKVFGLFVPFAWIGGTMFQFEGLVYSVLAANIIGGLLAWLWLRKAIVIQRA